MSVEVELRDHVLVITLNRPEKLNAIDLDTWHAFSAATQAFSTDEDAWVAIITGAGNRAFSAGADVGSTLQALIREPGRDPYPSPSTIMRGQQIGKPMIAAINGLALGGGFEVALACDIRITVEHARLGSPEVTLGLIPGWGATQRLTRELPWVVASRLIFTGEPISAAEALSFGLVNAVVKPEELMPECLRIANVICSRGPLALRAAKKAMVDGLGEPFEVGLRIEDRIFSEIATTQDAREGVSAFLERRPPNFTGR